MSESGDYSPAEHWSGYDFATARRTYDDHVRTSYTAAVKANVIAESLVEDELVCESESPIVIACDVTGSMGDWPATIFSKLPYLEHEGKEYLGQDMQISFCAIGDAFSDKYPLQVQPFVDGDKLEASLKKLVIEGGGGCTSQESYDFSALYYSRNCKFPNAIKKPIFIFIGDEGLYSFIDKEKAENIVKVKFDDDDDKKINIESVFKTLKSKFNVYIIRKPYNTNSNTPSEADTRIQNQWTELLGEDHVVSLPQADRVVDVIFGILAKETGRIEYFEQELSDRQLKDKDGKEKVDIVMRSLHTMHKLDPKSLKKLPGPKDVKSITRKKSTIGKRSISLLDDDDE